MAIPNQVLNLAQQKGYLNRRDVQDLIKSGISRDLIINIANRGVTTGRGPFSPGAPSVRFGPNALAELGISSVKGYDPSQYNPAVKYTQTGTAAPTKQTTYKSQTEGFGGYTIPGAPIYTVAQPVTLTDVTQQAAAPAPTPEPTPAPPTSSPAPEQKSETDTLGASIAAMQTGFQQQLQQQATQFGDIQRQQEERMTTLQEQMKQSLAQLAGRPTVAGVKTATGTSGTSMQIARRGARGAFGRSGMRIKSLNV